MDKIESQEGWSRRRERKEKVIEEYVLEGPEPDKIYIPSKKRIIEKEALDLTTKKLERR